MKEFIFMIKEFKCNILLCHISSNNCRLIISPLYEFPTPLLIDVVLDPKMFQARFKTSRFITAESFKELQKSLRTLEVIRQISSHR